MAFLITRACGQVGRIMGRWCAWAAIGLLSPAAFPAAAPDAVVLPSAEYQLKAVFLFNFAQSAQ